MEFKTGISKVTGTDVIIRGEQLSALMRECSFSDAIFLILRGKRPDARESKLFAAMLVAIIDHGMGTASALSARLVMSGGNSVNAAVAGGVLALGNYHGGAIEDAMRQLRDIKKEDATAYVREMLDDKHTIFGFGHKVYKDADPRVTSIMSLCAELGYTSRHIETALAIEQALEKEKGKKVILNVDGLIAAILLEMGFSPDVGKGFFVIGRTPGLVAHALEERAREKPVRRIDEDEIVYDGEGK